MQLNWKNGSVFLLLLAALGAIFFLWERPLDELGIRVYSRAFREDKVLALTFDDGPHPITTALLLDILRRYHVKATFFVVGQKAEEYPELLRRIAADGHQVASHTYSHHNLTQISAHEADNELTYWENDVDRIIGHASRYLRPPGGDYGRGTISLLRRRGYALVLWSVNPGDWHMPPPDHIIKYVLGHVHPGAILLMHDDGLNTVQALPAILTGLKKEGYRFLTVKEMMDSRH